ncbi:MAG: TerB family tellurite resistance protein, partial [Opitutaceae bacterium]|nr:TerB family tellurite resistance protein [Opitutaceae bacterium]
TPMAERARVLAALAHAAAADGVVRPEEHALLRAFAAALDCPAPLLAA